MKPGRKSRVGPPRRRPEANIGAAVAVVTIIYFVSGACSLIYQVGWVRLLKLTLGNTSYASSIVVSVFLGGLALGALLMARHADRVVRRLRLYAVLELAITISAVAMPWLLQLGDIVYGVLFVRLHHSPNLLLPIQVFISACLLLVPTVLMGSTLPLLGRYVTDLQSHMGHRVGRLYAINTLGAAVGCFLAGFVLIRLWGVLWTLYAAAGLNLLVAAGGWALSRTEIRPAGRAASPVEREPVPTEDQGGGTWYPVALCAAFFVSGLVSIGYELVWMRSIIIPLGTSTYVFAGVLTIYLLGNVIGAGVGSFLAKRSRHPALLFGVTLSILGLFGVFYISWFHLWFAGPAVHLGEFVRGSLTSVARAALPLLHCAVLFLLPSLVMGIGFPLALQSWGRLHTGVGRTTGNVYAVNTIGAVLGGLVTGFVLIPGLGAQWTAAVLGWLAILVGGALIVLSPGRAVAKRLVPVAAGSLAIVAGVVVPGDLFRTHAARGLIGQTIDVREGVTTMVVVSRTDDGHLLMAVDNIQMAGDDVHRCAQKTLGHLAVLLHPNPRTVLTVGFGTGETSACLAAHDLDRIDCVEIAPEVTQAALEHFQHINLGERTHEKINLVHMDGKNFLRKTDRTYDIILNDSNIHSTADSAPLYTREHFANAMNRLNPSGLFMTKLHLRGYPKTDFDCILRTFTDTFPHTTLWFPATRPFVFMYLVGSREPQRFLPARIDAELSKESVRASTSYLHFYTSADVLSCYAGDETDLRRYLGPGPINSDYRPFLEFNLDPHVLTLGEHFPPLIGTLRSNSLSRHLDFTGLDATARRQWQEQFDRHRHVSMLIAIAHGEHAFLSRMIASHEGLKHLPNYRPLLDLREKALSDIDGALTDRRVPPGRVLQDMIRLTDEDPQFGAAWLVKAIALDVGGASSQAYEAARKAVELDPTLWQAYEKMARLMTRLGESSDAREILTYAIERIPDAPQLHYALGLLWEQDGRIGSAAERFQTAMLVDPYFKPAENRLAGLRIEDPNTPPAR